MTFTEYETTVILRADLGGEAVEGTLDKVREVVRGRGGKLLAINHWGKRKLAYDIEKQSRGIYVHAQFLGGGDMVHEIERNLRISDSVLRFLTVRIAGDVDASGREEAAYVAPAYDAEDAAEETAGVDAAAPAAQPPRTPGAQASGGEAEAEAEATGDKEAEVES